MSEVVVERHGAVQVCRLNRPQERNGLTGALLRQYLAALEEARTDDAVRVVVTTGEGDAFSAGADMSDLDGESARQGLNVLMHEKLGSADTLSTAERTFDRLGIGRETLAIKNFDKPLIAAVNGAAAGGGFALAMLHDIRLASERATFTSAFVRIGLVAEMGLSYTLPRAIGLEAAMDMMFTGRSVECRRSLGHRPCSTNDSPTSGSWTRPWPMPSRSRRRPRSQSSSRSAHWRVHSTTRFPLSSNWSGHTKSPPLTPTMREKASLPSASGARRASADARWQSVRPLPLRDSTIRRAG